MRLVPFVHCLQLFQIFGKNGNTGKIEQKTASHKGVLIERA